MGRLPSYHVARPRLLAVLEKTPVGVVEAGGGFGKSVLASEWRAALDLPALEITLEDRHRDPALFAGAVAAAARRAGVVAAVPPGEPAAVVDAALDALSGTSEAVLVVVDDAHHAEGDAAALLVGLVERLPEPHRLLVLARRLPGGSERIERLPGTVLLSAADLALTVEELDGLLHAVRVEIGTAELGELWRATGGWTAAAVLAAHHLTRAVDPATEAERIAAQPAVLAFLVDESLAALTADERAAVGTLARLPLLSPEVAEAAGAPGLLERLRDAGLPLTPGRDGWLDLPGPVRDYLGAEAVVTPETARAVAAVYLRRVENVEALHVLIAAGESEPAAALLADLPPERFAAIDFVDLNDIVERLSEPAVAAHPTVLLRLARAAQPAARMFRRGEVLRRAEALLADGCDPVLARAVAAEVVRDVARDGRFDEAAERARVLLEEARPTELGTRARLLDTLGQALAWRMTPESLREAERHLGEAVELFARAGEAAARAEALAALGYMVHFSDGAYELALHDLDESVAAAGPRASIRGVALAFRAEVLVNAGRFDEAEVALRDYLALAERLRDRRSLAYLHWERARLASQLGDAATTVEAVQAVERQRGDWFDKHTGTYFLADAADLLDRVGEQVLARDYLARARARAEEAPESVSLAEAAIAARSGDPVRAAALLHEVDAAGELEPRERWRLTLLQAYASLRRGDPAAGALAARAFDEAAALGAPALPLTRERTMAESLLALAAEAGSRCAAELLHRVLPVHLAVLGRCELTVGGRPQALPPGQPEQLVKMLAVAGGRLHVEEAIEALWPETDPGKGRKLLRNILNRLHRGTEGAADAEGDGLVVRDGETLTLESSVTVDARLFEDEARRAVAGRDPALARAALARYRGDLLPGDPYEEWAALPRERLRRLLLGLCDLLVADAERRDDLDDALALVERALEADPDDDERYLRAARLLLAAGQPGRARSYLRRAAAARDALGLRPSDEYQRRGGEAAG